MKTDTSITQGIIRQEQLHGARVALVFRFIVTIGLAMSVIANYHSAGSESKYGNALNTVAVLAYFGVLILQWILMRKCSRELALRTAYLWLILDFILLSGLTIAWREIAKIESPAFLLKNPLLGLFVLPVIHTVFQFRIRLALFATSLYAVIYVSFVTWSVLNQVPQSNSWREYVLGDTVILADVMTTRFLPVLFTGLAIG